MCYNMELYKVTPNYLAVQINFNIFTKRVIFTVCYTVFTKLFVTLGAQNINVNFEYGADT